MANNRDSAADMPPSAANLTFGQLVDLLKQADTLLVLTHRNPDGDAVGAATALAAALRRLGKRVRVVCPDPLPGSLLVIPDAERIESSVGDEDWDLVVSVDVSDPVLLRPLPAAEPDFLASRPSLNIDHHVSNLLYARWNYVDATAASAAEIVYRIALALQVPLDVRLATQILYGFVNDTHSFQNSNTTPQTLRITADLLETGADLSGIIFNLLLARSPAAARLWSRVLPTLTFADDGRVAWLIVSLDALHHSGATMADADGLVEWVRSVRGVDLAIVYKQIGPDLYRLSMRTSDAVDATRIALAFGGGGHRRAAGCDIRGVLPEILERVLAEYRAARGDVVS